jgi:hypothetical protein
VHSACVITWTSAGKPSLTNPAAADSRSSIASCGAWRLLLTGTVCALVGTIFLGTGLSVFTLPELTIPEGWQAHGRDDGDPVEPVQVIASRIHEQDSGESTDPISSLRQGWAMPMPPLQPVSEISRPASRSLGGDELIPGPAVTVEERDLRLALLQMSAAQHTGRWTFARPLSPGRITYPDLTSNRRR